MSQPFPIDHVKENRYRSELVSSLRARINLLSALLDINIPGLLVLGFQDLNQSFPPHPLGSQVLGFRLAVIPPVFFAFEATGLGLSHDPSSPVSSLAGSLLFCKTSQSLSSRNPIPLANDLYVSLPLVFLEGHD